MCIICGMGGEDSKISLYVGTKTFLEVWEMVRRDCPDALPYLDMLMAEVEDARKAKAAEAWKIVSAIAGRL